MLKLIKVCQHSFFQNFLDNNSLVLDCGCNQGEFSQWIFKNMGCQIHGFEPDPRLYSKLPILPKCVFYPVAIGDENGELNLYLGERFCSTIYFQEDNEQNTIRVKVETIDDFCSKNLINRIDLLKLDIEGAEIPVLFTLKEEFLKKQVVQITVEFHDFLDKEVVLSIRKIIRKFKKIGFEYIKFSFFNYADVLFINKQYIELNSWDILKIKAEGFLQGLLRVSKRTFRVL